MNNRDLWEEEMEEMIHNTGEKLSVPERLRPENIKHNLLEKKRTVRAGRNRQVWHWCAAAAMFLLVCGCGVVWTALGGKPGFMGSSNEMAKTADMEEAVLSDVPEDEQDTEAEEEKLTYAKNYQEIQEVLEEIAQRGDVAYGEVFTEQYDMSDGEVTSGSDDFLASVSALNDSRNSSSASHSETNVSVEGIQEADQVSTDGEYIYRLRRKLDGAYCLDIIKAEGGTMELIGKYTCGDAYPVEFFLAEDQLILLSGRTYQGKASTSISFIDISDRRKPIKTHELIQTGSYDQARLQDGYLYTVSGTTVYPYALLDEIYYEEDAEADNGDIESSSGQEEQIPCLNGNKIPASQIYIPDGCNETSFTTITSVKLDDPSGFTDCRSILSSVASLHMTEGNIYFTTDKWKDSGKKQDVRTKTQITKFSYHTGKFSGKATKQINGSIKDTFAINEYQGNLRVISSISYTTGKADNAVYVLNEDLKIIGSIEHLAEDERVYSARFQGDIGYFVTYRETDPLFSVDFSDPKNPKILGKLKIPGFSEYMHFYNDHLLFGIGLEESGDGERESLKLSMFDISDPADVREIHKTLLNKIDYSQALYDYKAVLIDPEKNIIGFDVCGTYDDAQYYVYSYDEEKGFVRRIQAEAKDGEPSFSRGVYIEDTVYLVNLGSTSIRAYDWNSGECIGEYPKK